MRYSEKDYENIKQSEPRAKDALVQIYDPYASPADLELAFVHQKATSVNRGIEFTDPLKKCSCCSNNYDVEAYSLSDRPDSISNMGVAYPVLFKFTKFLILVSVIVFLLSGLPLILTSTDGLVCLFKGCEPNPYSDEYEEHVTLNHLMALASIIVVIIMKNIFAYKMRKFEHKVDLNLDTASDFTAYVRGLGTEMTTDDIVNLFSELDGRKINVAKVNKIYRIDNYVSLLTEYLMLEKKLKLMDKAKDKDYEKVEVQFTQVEAKVLHLQSEFDDKGDHLDNHFTGEAFVTFETDKELFEVIRYYRPNLLLLCFHKGIKVRRACEPGDVLWANYGLTLGQKVFRRLLSVLIAGVLILGCFFAILGIKTIQQRYRKASQKIVVTLLDIGISIIIGIINIIFIFALSKMTEWERRQTFSQHQLSLTGKLFIGMFVNTAVVLTVLGVTDNIWYLFGSSGIAKTVLTVLIFNVFINPLLTLVDIWYFHQLFWRWRIRSKVAAGQQVFQCEANEAFEGPPFYAERYFARSLKTISVSLFFTPIVPEALLISVFELILNYWVWKHLLVNRVQAPKQLGFTFCRWVVTFFEFAVVIYAVGFMVFDSVILGKPTGYSIAMLVIALVDLLVLNSNLFILLFKKNYDGLPSIYSQKRVKFANEYDRLNPITQKKAYKEWMEYIGVISDKSAGADEPEQQLKNVLASVFDYVSQTNAFGKGGYNLYPQNNPFVVVDPKKDVTLLNLINFYKIEDQALRKLESQQGAIYSDETDVRLGYRDRYQSLADYSDQRLPYDVNFYDNLRSALNQNFAPRPNRVVGQEPYNQMIETKERPKEVQGHNGGSINNMLQFIASNPYYLNTHDLGAQLSNQAHRPQESDTIPERDHPLGEWTGGNYLDIQKTGSTSREMERNANPLQFVFQKE